MTAAVIAFASVVGSPETFARCAGAGLRRAAEPDSPLAELTEARSMTSAANEVLDAFAPVDGLEALVLLHEDAELLDRDFCARVRHAFARAPRAAVLGVVGARGVGSLRWWEGEGFGHVSESRGVADFGGGSHAVDTVDGLLLVLSRWAVRNLRFDEERYDAFHGYDADLCFQARAAGREVRVEELRVFHHTKGGYGDEAAFLRADEAFRTRWAHMLPSSPPPAGRP